MAVSDISKALRKQKTYKKKLRLNSYLFILLIHMILKEKLYQCTLFGNWPLRHATVYYSISAIFCLIISSRAECIPFNWMKCIPAVLRYHLPKATHSYTRISTITVLRLSSPHGKHIVGSKFGYLLMLFLCSFLFFPFSRDKKLHFMFSSFIDEIHTKWINANNIFTILFIYTVEMKPNEESLNWMKNFHVS